MSTQKVFFVPAMLELECVTSEKLQEIPGSEAVSSGVGSPRF